jgi:hypothetical protein
LWENKIIENFTQHLPSDSWLDIFGPIISKFVHEETFNPLLLIHHVVHIPKYSLFEIR